MRSRLFAGVVIFAGSLAWAATDNPKTGTIMSEKSVDCGNQAHGHNQKEKLDLVCQEYVVHTDATEYHIRQPKQKDQALLPLNTGIDFVLDKDKMKFKLNGKKYEFLVVSEDAVTAKQP
jgi:hypothetical protein